jgi:hypothetical protein
MLNKWPKWHIRFLAGVVCYCFSSCVTASDAVNLCGPEDNVWIGIPTYAYDTLTPASPYFYLATPHTAGSHCDVTFSLFFAWADSTRRANDATVPPLSDLVHAFHADNDLLSYPNDVQVVHRTDFSDGKNWWQVQFTDHYIQDTVSQCTYYIKTYLSSGNRTDATIADARITYHTAN